MTLGCWEDLKADVVQKSFDQLEPGGWFEAQDLLSSILCDDDTMADDNPLKLHFEDIEDATASEGRPLNSGDKWRKACEEVGFVDITEYVFKVPINGWPRELRWKELGKMWEANCLHGIQAVTYGPLGRIRHLSRNQMEVRQHKMLDNRVFSSHFPTLANLCGRCYYSMYEKRSPIRVYTLTRSSSSSSAGNRTLTRWASLRVLLQRRIQQWWTAEQRKTTNTAGSYYGVSRRWGSALLDAPRLFTGSATGV